MKILAVDDDPVFLGLLLTMLSAAGHSDVMTASSGHLALRLLDDSSTPFDCILLDIQMPGMSGVELCAEVRKRRNYRRTPVVMITAMSGKRFIDDAFAAGATDYMVKPLDRHDLNARMGMVCRLQAERMRTIALEEQIGLANSAPALDFGAPILIDGVERGIEYLALENYLLMLGKSRLHAVSAFGIHVTNAGFIFGQTDNWNFMNVLGDVATVLLDALKAQDVLLAYAGSGYFVCVLRSPLTSDLEQIEAAVGFGLEEFNDLYRSEHLPLPNVRLSALVRHSLLGVLRPTRILELALAMPQPSDAPLPAWRKLVA